MSNSQQVFRLRKEGRVDEACALAREDVATPSANDWSVRALSWCLIDLIKRAASQKNQSDLVCLAAELERLPALEEDEILNKQRRFALSLAESGRHEILSARNHSKAGQHAQAARLYQDLFAHGALYPSDHPGYGWDLYRWTRDILSGPDDSAPADIGQARRNLNAYMKLTVERPSPLHSCMLKIAWQLASLGHLKLPAFLDLWGIGNFLPDDYDRFTTPDGKTLPAIAEKVVQRAAKDAAASGDTKAMQTLMPNLKVMMERYPDNPWFRQNMVKFLSGLGREGEAREQAILFAREKSREFWAWDLLGDLQQERHLRIACYCRGLLCPADEGFVGRLRLKLAKELGPNGFPSEARGEVETVLSHRQRSGYRVPREAEQLAAEPWYSAATTTVPNKAFYARFAKEADELLFADLSWIDACAGDTFTLNGDDRKRRRRIYVPDDPFPREISISERALGLANLSAGHPIRIKADLGDQIADRAKIYTASLRDAGQPFDIFPKVIGIVDHVNTKKGVLHIVAGRDRDGILPLSELSAEIGDHVALRLARYNSRQGTQTRVVSAERTDAAVSEAVCRPFRASVRVSNGMGFTDDGIFISPDMVQEHDIQDADVISGNAVINFNKKKRLWGWKALSIKAPEEKGVP